MKLLTAKAASERLRDHGVSLSPSRLRQMDDELQPIRVEDGRSDGVRVYRADALDRFAARRTGGAR